MENSSCNDPGLVPIICEGCVCVGVEGEDIEGGGGCRGRGECRRRGRGECRRRGRGGV